MQFLNFLLLLTIPFLSTTIQDSAPVNAPSDLRIEKKSWTKSYPPVGGDRDPFAPNDLMRERVLAAREAQIVNRQRIANAEPIEKPRSIQINTSSLPNFKPGQAYYSYSVTLKNTGTKTVKTVLWAYVFTDTVLQEQVGRTVSENYVKLRPGKSVEMVGYSSNHAVQVVNAKSAGTRNPIKEEVLILRIDYEDGTFWERPAPPSEK
ncbi:MAG TPA: hypothetical protein VJU84_19035 [Pyrinomonadaceae bacterium]|nr:hypothetical protein [Pyrinomonadaceae bacterium]